MGAFLALLLGLALLLVLLLMRRGGRADRQALAAPDPALARLLDAQLPWRVCLTRAQRKRHLQHVQRLLQRLEFYGCNGFEVQLQQAQLVCGIAALLWLRDDSEPFPALRSVLLYAAAFGVRDPEPDELGLVWDEPLETLGESWSAQRVILSWAAVEAALAGEPLNVVVHEFSHQLDDLAPEAEGAPPLKDFSDWSRVMASEFAALQQRDSPVIDSYGAQSPAEFFAVVMESFFQDGPALRQQHPELYQLLAGYVGFETHALIPSDG